MTSNQERGYFSTQSEISDQSSSISSKIFSIHTIGKRNTQSSLKTFSSLSIKHNNKATIFSSFINLCNANIGAGLLGLPFAIAKSGLLMGILLFVFFGFLTAFAFNILMDIGRLYPISSYAIICHKIDFPKMQYISDGCIAIHYLFSCTAYLIIIGDFLPLIMKSDMFFGQDVEIFSNRIFWIGIYLIFLIIPTTIQRELNTLRYTSAIAMICFIFVTLVVVLYASNVFSLQFNDGINHQNIGDNLHIFPPNIFSFFESAPVYIFAYGGHALAYSLCTEMENNNLWNIDILLGASFFVISVIYTITGVAGYVTFGTDIKSNILVNYPVNDYLIISVRIAMSVAVAFSYPVIANPFKQSLASLLFFRSSSRNYSSKKCLPNTPLVDFDGRDKISRHSGSTTEDTFYVSEMSVDIVENADISTLPWHKYYILVFIMMLATFMLAVLIEDLGFMLSLDGATVGTMIQLINPGIIYYYAHCNYGCDHALQELRKNSFNRVKKCFAIALIVFGIIFMPLSLTLLFV